MTAKIEILYFTDPFCSWCWATEAPLFRLREVYRDQLQVKYVMGGLVEDMTKFYDASNDIRGTAQVAPHWRMVSERSGQPIDERLMEDITDPHWSTWPACIAVKAAELQGTKVGDKYLRRLRRAALTERLNVSVREVQLRLAETVAGLDVSRLTVDMDRDETRQAFSADLKLGREYGATGFPTLLFRRVSASEASPEEPEGILVGGHRSYQTYVQVLNRVVPGLEQASPRPVPQLLATYGPLTTRELAEVTGTKANDLRADLTAAANEGHLKRIEVRQGEFWDLA
ncbi:MAG TPA: DsbA family protein [Symbiobacteriaceae bacterium]|jgi:predicted DsbA family dithiol-disulfide isomerase